MAPAHVNSPRHPVTVVILLLILLAHGPAPSSASSSGAATPGGASAAGAPSGGSHQLLTSRLEPYPDNRWYWSYGGEPVFPVGSNLIPAAFLYHANGRPYDYVAEELDPLAAHLDGHWGILRVALHPGGGQNYTPPRIDPPGGGDWEALAAYEKTPGGAYDLDAFNELYWTRLRDYLVAARERHLFAWVELWDTHVYARLDGSYSNQEDWYISPFYPPNHVESQSGSLPTRAIDFLNSLSDPALHYKNAFIRKLLETTADLGTVLYLHDNENELRQAVREHWASFINDFDRNLCFGFSTHRDHGFQRDDDPPNGTPAEETWIEFFDTGFQYKSSEDCNNPRSHAGRIKKARDKVSTRASQYPRRVPVGGTQILAFPWHNVFRGAAAVRYHRLASAHYSDCYNPDENWGELLDVIRNIARFVNSVAIHATTPDYDGDYTRGNDRSYALVDTGELYLVYLENGGDVEVDLRDVTGDVGYQWFNPRSGGYQDPGTREGSAWRRFTPPSPSNEEWILVIEQSKELGENQPPEVGIVYPLPGATIGGTVDVTISCSDDVAVAALRLYVDDRQLGETIENPGSTEILRWDTTDGKHPSGSYVLRAEAVDNEGVSTTSQPTELVVANVPTAPTVEFHLSQNCPNPFNPVTDIVYDLPCEGQVVLRVFDVRGQGVRALVDAVMPAGQHGVRWYGLDDLGRPVASGVYFYELRTASAVARRKMLLLQ